MNSEKEILGRLDALSQEKMYLGAIRSLRDDDRFCRFLSGFKARFEDTVAQMDATKADNSLAISELKGVRNAYRYEIALIETSSERIKSIDEQLTLLNKQRKNKPNGKEGASNIVPPKEK